MEYLATSGRTPAVGDLTLLVVCDNSRGGCLTQSLRAAYPPVGAGISCFATGFQPC
jgi:hypothetical protein